LKNIEGTLVTVDNGIAEDSGPMRATPFHCLIGPSHNYKPSFRSLVKGWVTFLIYHLLLVLG